jgi:hypothetical protein
MPGPTDAHRKLEVMVGKWIGEETMHPSPWDPKGGTARGIVENRLVLGGFAIVQDYAQERDGRTTFEGHGVVTWSQPESCYVMYWWDSMGQPPNVYKGQFDNEVLTMTAAHPAGRSRAILDFGEVSSYTFSMQNSPDGVEWQPMMDGRYVRQR